MPAPSKNFTSILDAAIDSGSPITAELMTQIRDSLVHLEEWLGKDYTAAQNHSHNGVDSALVAIGPNWMRNGSFEDGLTNWTSTTYTGGSIATTTAHETDAATGVAITSTVAANGGGNLLSDEYIPVIGGQTRQFMVSIKASGATVPIKAQAVWYDDAKAQISASDIISITTSPTSARLVVRRIDAPATARYVRVKLELPTGAGGTGTIYFDSVIVGLPHMLGLHRLFTSNGTYGSAAGDVWGDLWVQVQAAGGEGADNVFNGSAGGSSSFSTISATGGGAGTTASVGGAGGSGSGGSINRSGEPGQSASAGYGGASPNALRQAALSGAGLGPGGGGAGANGTTGGGGGGGGFAEGPMTISADISVVCGGDANGSSSGGLGKGGFVLVRA